MNRALVVIAAVAMLAAAALAHGVRTDRWGASIDLRAAAAKLQGLPKEVGDWTSEDGKLSDAEVAVAQVAGHLVRHYRHKYTREAVTVMILCGRPGPVAVHTPEICYAGAGYAPGPPTRHPLNDGWELWQADFVKPGATHDTLRIYWGWSADGQLVASTSPRIDFARAKALYKLYVIRPLAGPTAGNAAPPELELLNSLRPFLKECLTPGP